MSLPTSRQRRAVRLARQLAANPFVRSDYAIPDADGHMQEHLLIEDFVFTYWLDHAVREVRITDLEDASLSPVGLNTATKGQVKCSHLEEVAEVMKD